ncbi:hypothetical protein DTO164E3_135 [Paecilomyces variotii]|nr:hypothetical protein DTO032I3_9201 [Paecilomyces variotii]KAJ9207849.1 hypothetical protein DTO164E3_135 [Paecilomyces variotii]KAJ9269028.1 hypothetical protein DTO212C5_4867 [Paecilomyces variotii]KAJ9280568.1 hypothetical protein DTO021D3_2418 [Paecilomyces variotii]KAJ9285319.1 hypothetical protein DTO021C3_7111 [Paecilomyces variotii]
MPPKHVMSGAAAPPSTPAARIRPPPAGSPEAPILVPSEAGSDVSDVSELLRQLRGLLLEFRFGSDLSRFMLYRTIALLRG